MDSISFEDYQARVPGIRHRRDQWQLQTFIMMQSRQSVMPHSYISFLFIPSFKIPPVALYLYENSK